MSEDNNNFNKSPGVDKSGFAGENPARGMNNKVIGKKFIAAAVIFAVILAAAVAGAWALLNMKSTRDLYFDIEGKNLTMLYEDVKKAYDEGQERLKPYRENVFQSRSEISGKLTPGNIGDVYRQVPPFVWDLVEKGKVIYDTRVDYKGEKSTGRLSYLLEGQSIMEADLFCDGKTIGLSVPAVYDKYFTADIDNIYQVYGKFGIKNGPRKLLKLEDFAGAVSFPEPDIRYVIKDFGRVICENVPKDKVTLNKNIIKSFDSYGKIKGREFTLSLTDDEFKAIAGNLLDRASKDKALLGLTFDNYSQALKLLDEGGYLDSADLRQFKDKLLYDKSPEEAVKFLKDGMGRIKLPEGFKMIVFADSKDRIAERKIVFPFIDADGVKRDLDVLIERIPDSDWKFKAERFDVKLVQAMDNGQNAGIEFGLSSRADQEVKDGQKRIKDGQKRVKDGQKRIYEGYINCANNFWEDFKTRFNLDITDLKDDVTLADKQVINFNIEHIQGKDGVKTDRILGSVSSTSKKNDKRKTININNLIKVGLNLETAGISGVEAEINVKREDRFGVELNLPNITEGNSINLNKATPGEFKGVEEEIRNSFLSFLLKNQPLFQGLQ